MGQGLSRRRFAQLDPAVVRRLIRELNRHHPTLSPAQELLTEREVEVLVLVVRGLAVAEIADKLLISEPTVYRYIDSILTKFRQGPGSDDPLEPPLPLPIPVR